MKKEQPLLNAGPVASSVRPIQKGNMYVKKLPDPITKKFSNNPGKNGSNDDPDILKQMFNAWNKLK